MEVQKVLEVLETELMCVERNESKRCDRRCEHCDLVMDTDIIKEAYREAASAVVYRRNVEVVLRRFEDERNNPKHGDAKILPRMPDVHL